LEESIKGLQIKANGTYVDATFGGGGHSKAILDQLKKGKLVAFDRDSDAKKNNIKHPYFTFIQNNFRFMRSCLRNIGIEEVDGILADLGVSSHQFDTGVRGFSFRFDTVLDMRMNQGASLTAAKIINTYPEEKLSRIFRLYGEVENTGKVVQQILIQREQQPIETIGEFVEILKPCTPKFAEHKYLAKIFQALRIETNGEITALQQMLEQSVKILRKGGRLVVISYHSLEDRMVKNFMRAGNAEGKIEKDFYGNEIAPFTVISKKAITPKEEEIAGNTRARSAKLRIAEKK